MVTSETNNTTHKIWLPRDGPSWNLSDLVLIRWMRTVVGHHIGSLDPFFVFYGLGCCLITSITCGGKSYYIKVTGRDDSAALSPAGEGCDPSDRQKG